MPNREFSKPGENGSGPDGNGYESLGPIDQLLRAGMLDPPARPGFRATRDHFDIVGHIGTGGMAFVQEALDRNTKERVAFKIVKPQLKDNAYVVGHFLRETRHLQKLDHPHIVKVRHVGNDPDKGPYFVMPLLGFQGHASLAHRLQLGQRLTDPELLSVALQLAKALAYAHDVGISHRDVKPSNVLLDSQGQCVLCDFGLALATNRNDTLTRVGQSQCDGTPYYMSPKVASGKSEPERCDIYSLGAVMYEMLTGRPPYYEQARSSAEVIRLILEGPPLSIRKINPKAHEWLTQVAGGCMAREHRYRYASMEDVVADLKRAAEEKKPQHDIDRLWRRRLTITVSITFACIAALITILAALPKPLGDHKTGATASGEPRLQLSRRIEVPGLEGSWFEAQAGFWNDDRIPDFFLSQTGAWMVVSGESPGKILSQPDSEERRHKLSINPVPRAGGHDIFVSWSQVTDNSTNAQFALVNHRRQPYSAYAFRISGEGKHYDEVTLAALGMARVAPDGLEELITTATAAYKLRPRGLFVFRPGTEGPVWSHEFAGGPMGMVTMDADGDGTADILCGSGAPNNGNRLPDGTDDGNCYLYALSRASEKPLWRPIELGGISTACRPVVARTNHSGGLALFAWVQGDRRRLQVPGPPEVGSIVRLNPTDGKVIKRIDVGAALQDCTAHDLDRDGQDEIIATDRLGRIRVFDLNLDPTNSTNLVPCRFDTVHLQIAGITNFTASRREESIVLTSVQDEFVGGDPFGRPSKSAQEHHAHDITVYVLDTALRTVASHTLSGLQTNSHLKALLLDMDEDGIPEIVTLTEFESPRILKLVR